MNTTPDNLKKPFEYPLLGDRVQSSFIDLMLIVGMMFFLASLLDRYPDPPGWLKIVLFAGLWLVYEPLCTSLGCTLGNYVKGLRVRQFDNTNKKINIFQALVRYIIKSLWDGYRS